MELKKFKDFKISNNHSGIKLSQTQLKQLITVDDLQKNETKLQLIKFEFIHLMHQLFIS